jgi:hypothetical protein
MPIFEDCPILIYIGHFTLYKINLHYTPLEIYTSLQGCPNVYPYTEDQQEID